LWWALKVVNYQADEAKEHHSKSILSKSKILILAEATSAFDIKTEKEVQEELDNVSQGIALW
jgi:ABC-type Na+ transport system ATPase subunit NatA